MKCTIPEISWHNRDPVLSVDIQANKLNESTYRLATGGTDSHVLIWIVTVEKCAGASLECAADLTRHTKPVNCVRFAPSGELLASGDDEACIIIWRLKSGGDPLEFPLGEEDSFKEQWTSVRVLRGHLQDVYDLSWSSDSKNLISGSVDNTAILWDIPSGKNLSILSEHKGFVQGVTYDPCGQYVATISSDRVCRVYNTTSRRVVHRLYKGLLPGRDADSKPSHFFHDDTLKSFFRRLTFTPDGELLIIPSALVEELGKKPSNCTVVCSRHSLGKPLMYLPSLSQYSVAVRCCPVYFVLLPDTEPLLALPYRVVIAVATQSSVVLYDTQHAAPFAIIANIHYTRLTDLSWSSDGRVLVVSSTDGYCSVITFSEGELGTVYTGSQASTTKSDKLPMECAKPKNTGGSNLPPSEDANMPLALEGSRPDDKTETLSKEKPTQENMSEKLEKQKPTPETKETPMEVDDFQLVYEGTVTEPVLESKHTVKTSNTEEAKLSVTTSHVEAKQEVARLESQPKASEKPSEQTEEDLINEKETANNSEQTEKDLESSVKPVTESPKKADVCGVQPLTSPQGAGAPTPGNSTKKTPRRVQLITLSSPKSKKRLLD